MVRKNGLKMPERAQVKKTPRLATFVISHRPCGNNIRFIGHYRYGKVEYSEPDTNGTIFIQGDRFPIVDPQYVQGIGSRKLTEESCVVIIDPAESRCRFGKAVLVDNIWELIALASGRAYAGVKKQQAAHN